MVRLRAVSGVRVGGDPEWLEVLRLGIADWRVSDTRRNEGDPARVLGYLERVRRGRYEVLWLSDPIGWAYVSTFSEGVAAFVDAEHFAGAVDAEREVHTLPGDGSMLPRRRRVTAAGRTSLQRI